VDQELSVIKVKALEVTLIFLLNLIVSLVKNRFDSFAQLRSQDKATLHVDSLLSLKTDRLL
jgi:hypothetical protein